MKTYHIDESRIGNLQKRSAISMGLVMFGTMLIIMLLNVSRWTDFVHSGDLYAFAIMPVIVAFALIIGLSMLKKRYKTYEIVIDDLGIRSQMETGLMKRVAWPNALVTHKKNGFVLVEDKSISPFMRWWNGSGRIFVFPEMLNRDELIADINTRTQSLITPL